MIAVIYGIILNVPTSVTRHLPNYQKVTQIGTARHAVPVNNVKKIIIGESLCCDSCNNWYDIKCSKIRNKHELQTLAETKRLVQASQT